MSKDVVVVEQLIDGKWKWLIACKSEHFKFLYYDEGYAEVYYKGQTLLVVSQASGSFRCNYEYDITLPGKEYVHYL